MLKTALVDAPYRLHPLVPCLLEEHGLIHLFLLFIQPELEAFDHLDLLLVDAVTSTEEFLTAVKPLFGLAWKYLEIRVDYVSVPAHVHRSKVAHNVVATRLSAPLEIVVWRVKRELVLLPG